MIHLRLRLLKVFLIELVDVFIAQVILHHKFLVQQLLDVLKVFEWLFGIVVKTNTLLTVSRLT